MVSQTLHINNMICDCCIRVVEMELNNISVKVNSIKLGEINVSFDPDIISIDDIEKMLNKNGFSLLVDKDSILIENIKHAIIDLVHHTTYNAMVRNSDYIVGKFGRTYPYLSSLFSKYEGITLEKYIILQKTEKVKSLIREDEVTLSEIAFIMGYSSVQYLSTQFKNVTGISVSEFKKSPANLRKSIDDVNRTDID
ncbi:MAG: AraC family transcriptional regulator [Bacteroidota bacterium]